MYVAREMTGRSLPFIGKKIGGRDHTTILHGVRVVKGLIVAGDAERIAAVDQIIERLQVLRTGRA
jgi:chromosomal replication initiator protein